MPNPTGNLEIFWFARDAPKKASARGRLSLAALDDLFDVGAIFDGALDPIADARPRRRGHGLEGGLRG